MMDYSAILAQNALFDGISEDDIRRMSACIGAQKKSFLKDEFIFRAGDEVRSVYIICSGSIHIIDEDFWGNRSLIETMHESDLFGEAYALSDTERHLVSVIAAEPLELMVIDPERLFKTCTKNCLGHTLLVRNTACILSEKIVRLTQKLSHVIRRTTREKLMSYLSSCAIRAQSPAFNIPYSRQQLADYLAVDRSALSHELSKLANEGILRYHKSRFELLEFDNNRP